MPIVFENLWSENCSQRPFLRIKNFKFESPETSWTQESPENELLNESNSFFRSL